MSIFFDFDVGPSGSRFRRAVNGDVNDIELFINREHTENIFGEVDIGSIIELSTLSICMINERKDVTGFMALCDHPNIPGVDPADWEDWIRNMYQKYFMSRTTLFIKFMCCKESVRDIFLEEAFRSVFRNDVYLTRIVLFLNSGCDSEHVTRYQQVKKWSMYRYSPRRQDDSETNPHYMFVALRQDYCPKLKIRRAVQEDNDDVVKILDKRCPRLKEMYGKYYISELIGDHPENNRKIIVAENQERAVGVMCLNTDINFASLHDVYDLRPYHGLRKSTAMEKELMKRNNTLLRDFGEPIMLGKFSPFDRPNNGDADTNDGSHKVHSKENFTRTNSDTIQKQSKVYFKPKLVSLLRRSTATHIQASEDFSEKGYRSSSNVSKKSLSPYLLDDDPFDYEIINIDKSLLSIKETLSCEQLFKSCNSSCQSLPSEPRQCTRKIRNKSSAQMDRKVSDTPKYLGESNAFLIELFGLNDDVDDRKSIDFLEAAFEIMDVDYCIISIPSAETTFPLLQHFTFVPTKQKTSSEYSLFIAHRCSILGKFRVRKAEIMDIPQIALFLKNIERKETLYTIELSIVNKNSYNTYVFMTGITIIGIGILESPSELNFLRVKYNIDPYHYHKYHLGEAGFSSIKAILVYPVFEVHFRFFAREMMRLSGANSLFWMTGYRNKLVAHKTNGMALAMVPLLPRKTEYDFSKVPELIIFSTMSKNMMPFSTWFLDKKLTSVPMVTITTRILIIGASRTSMAFLNALLFGPASTYLIFTNVTLISSSGLPYMRQSNAAVDMMFPKYFNNSEKYLKSVPYTYYVNVLSGTLAEINKQEKYITLTSGSKFHYDLLFLLIGKQYQHPEYLKPLEEYNTCTSKSPYVRLDVPNYNIEPDVITYNTPENVFIINHVVDANKALKYVKSLLNDGLDFTVIVYGSSIHAYCCLTALLEINVPATSIIFVDPFPPEDPKKTRVSVFYNSYVDQTVAQVIKNLNIKVYRSYYFQSWTECNDIVVSVEFLSQFNMISLECSAFFYYGKRGVNTQVFLAMNKCGMAYDGGILIDHQFRTKDPSIYAAGPATSYYRRYYSPNKKQQYYDTYDVGEKLGTQIRNQLDPLFGDKIQKSVCVRFSLEDESDKPDNFSSMSNSCNSSLCSASSINKGRKEIFEKPDQILPSFVKPKVLYCKLPGGLQYLEVRSPGKKIPNYYVQSLHFTGIVMETFRTGYFKLHMTSNLVVDGITCLTFEKYSLEQFRNLYGLPSVVLNNVYLRYATKKLDDFFEFFRARWAHFLYHDQTDELFAMVKELLPKNQTTGDTLKEQLRETGVTQYTNAALGSKKWKMRNKLETTPHVEAVIHYVIDWLSEHDVLFPMYMQPTDVTEYVFDTERHPAFRKQKKSLEDMIMKGF